MIGLIENEIERDLAQRQAVGEIAGNLEQSEFEDMGMSMGM